MQMKGHNKGFHLQISFSRRELKHADHNASNLTMFGNLVVSAPWREGPSVRRWKVIHLDESEAKLNDTPSLPEGPSCI